MLNTPQSKEGFSQPEPGKLEALLNEIEEVTGIIEDANVRLHVLEYHRARLEAEEIVAGSGQSAASRTYTVDELSEMVSTYFDSPLQMMALWHMFKSGDPVQQQEAVQCVLAAKRAHEKQRVS